jgi:hypothetical protein
MTHNRRHADLAEPQGFTAVMVVTGGTEADPSELAAACQEALRQTDAVLERREGGGIAVLLRHLRDRDQDTRTIAARLRRAGLAATGAPVRVAVAVAQADDEPLDLLLSRAAPSLVDIDANDTPGPEQGRLVDAAER